MIIPIIVSIGSALALKMPPAYRSKAKILYYAPDMNKRLVQSFVNLYLEWALPFIGAEVFSRDNAEEAR